MTLEGPFIQISLDAEGVGKPLEPKPSRSIEAKAVIVKDVSVAVAKGEEIQLISMDDYEPMLRREGSIASQVTIDTSPVVGSVGG